MLKEFEEALVAHKEAAQAAYGEHGMAYASGFLAGFSAGMFDLLSPEHQEMFLKYMQETVDELNGGYHNIEPPQTH